jgi:hypothetical protein
MWKSNKVQKYRPVLGILKSVYTQRVMNKHINVNLHNSFP